MEKDMTLKKLEALLISYLDLQSRVIGVQLIRDRSTFDAIGMRHIRHKVNYCYMVKMASAGRSRKAALDNFACDAASKILGLEDYYETEEGIQGWLDSGLYGNRQSAERQHQVCAPPPSRITGVAVAPLSRFDDSPPDVIMIACTPYQAMRFVQGYAFYFGARENLKMSGMCGICFESTALPLRENDLAVSLLCSGTRFLCKWPDDLLMVSIPFGKLAQTIDGIIATANPCEPDAKKHVIRKRLKHPHETYLLLRSNYYLPRWRKTDI